MTEHEQRIAKSFNKAANTYYHHDSVQAEAGKSLIQTLISSHSNFPRVLDAGCGTGHTTRILADKIQHDSILAIDIAEKLLNSDNSPYPESIHRRLLNFDEISHQHQTYNLIFSNMSLQWSHSLQHTLEIFHKALDVSGQLAFSIPLQGTFQEINEYFAIYPLPSKMEIDTMLKSTGYEIIHLHQHYYHYQFKNALTALRSIKATGATFTNQKKSGLLLGKSSLITLPIKQLSYLIGFYIARKK